MNNLGENEKTNHIKQAPLKHHSSNGPAGDLGNIFKDIHALLKGKIDGMSPKDWFAHMFDHTIVVAEDDPEIIGFKHMDQMGVAQVRIVPATGAEKFAEFIYNKVNPFIVAETENRVKKCMSLDFVLIPSCILIILFLLNRENKIYKRDQKAK